MKKPPIFFLGSLPFSDPAVAIDFVRRASPLFPFLPQLPVANPQEDMVGQILRGCELGYWDETASICFPDFIETFLHAPKVKIQMAGPFTVASALSAKFNEMAPQWLALATNVLDQMRQAGMKSEIWLQIDEPVWSRKRLLPAAYPQFLQLARSLDKATRLGIHSCAEQRPEMTPDVLENCRFFSFNFSGTGPSDTEAAFWKQALADGKYLVAGILPEPGLRQVEMGHGFPWGGENIWVSTKCGLMDWTPGEVEKLLEYSKRDA